jgi:hypothetical protein
VCSPGKIVDSDKNQVCKKADLKELRGLCGNKKTRGILVPRVSCFFKDASAFASA